MHRRVHGSAHVHAHARSMQLYATDRAGVDQTEIPYLGARLAATTAAVAKSQTDASAPGEGCPIDPRSPRVPQVVNLRTLVRCYA